MTGGGENYVTQHELNQVVNNLSNNLIGTANNLQINQTGLQQQILDLDKNNILLGTFYYRLHNPNTNTKNFITKRTTQTETTNNLYHTNYESMRRATDGINVNSQEIEDSFVYITGSNIFKQLYTNIFNQETSFPHERIDIETLSYVNKQDTVYGKVIYNDGIVPGTSTVTSLRKLTFTVLGATGRFVRAKTMVVEFINDEVFDSSNKDIRPRMVKVFS